VRTRAVAAPLSCAVVSALLTGCASDTERYCGALEDKQQELKELAEAAGERDEDTFADTLAVLEELRSDAPDDIVDEWDTLIFSLQSLEGALSDAGVEPGEYRPGAPAPGVNEQEADRIEAAAADLRSQPVVAAGEGIEQHAVDVCGINLTL
jgi:hypothetical protein